MILARTLACATALATGAVLAADYYPLEQGRSWSYRARVTTPSGEIRESEFSRRTMPARTVLGRDAVPLEYSHGPEVTGWVFVVEDATGVQWLARQNAGEPEATRYGGYVMHEPLAPGTHWTDTSRPFLLGLEEDVEIEVRILDAEGPVQTEAGRFDDCLVVDMTGRKDIALGDDEAALTIRARDWHCRDVGFVRSAASHRLKSASIDVRGTRVEELTGYAPAGGSTTR